MLREVREEDMDPGADISVLVEPVDGYLVRAGGERCPANRCVSDFIRVTPGASASMFEVRGGPTVDNAISSGPGWRRGKRESLIRRHHLLLAIRGQDLRLVSRIRAPGSAGQQQGVNR